ncbi:DUF4329 domain-containing protein [Pseudomonas sp. 3A(2025)]
MFNSLDRSRRSIRDSGTLRLPALSRAFDTPDEAARYAHARIGNKREREYGGFILIRADGKYVATEPMAGSRFEFDPNQVFPEDEVTGEVFYPDAHEDWAIYHSHPDTSMRSQHWSSVERQTYPNMFSTADLYASIMDRAYTKAFYLSGPDGSLISYAASGSQAEDALLVRLSGPAASPEKVQLSELQQGLYSGALLPSDFVRLVTQAGELRVLIASAMWGQTGKVSADWRPYSPPTVPRASRRDCGPEVPAKALALSPSFKEADQAARHVHGLIGARAHGQIVTALLFNPATGDYRAIEPFQDDGQETYAPCSVGHPDALYRPPLPPGYRIDGLLFAPSSALAEACVDNDFFRPDDLHLVFVWRALAARPQGLPVRYGFTMTTIYHSSPDGRLLSYTPSYSSAEKQLAGQVARTSVKSSFLSAQLASGALTPAGFIRQVAAAGVLRTLV